jgi:hypothetical protein
MSAILEPAGSGVAGTRTQGVVKQYQASGTGSSASTLETITPYDSGTILGHVQPGGSGEKLVSGVVQRASQLLVDGTVGVVGNALVPTYSTLNTNPVPPTGSTAADGLSQAPQHE